MDQRALLEQLQLSIHIGLTQMPAAAMLLLSQLSLRLQRFLAIRVTRSRPEGGSLKQGREWWNPV